MGCYAAPEILYSEKNHRYPQSFIDGLVNEDGSALTDAQRDALQNPGY